MDYDRLNALMAEAYEMLLEESSTKLVEKDNEGYKQLQESLGAIHTLRVQMASYRRKVAPLSSGPNGGGHV
jgi:hypothetical protein